MGFFSSSKKDNSTALNAAKSADDSSLIPVTKLPLAEDSSSDQLPETYKKSLPKLKQDYEKTEEAFSKEQVSLYDQVFNTLNDPLFKLPTTLSNDQSWKKAIEKEYEQPGWTPLSSYEKFFLTRECIIRFLVGCKWEYHQTISKLIETLVWRRDFGLTYDPTAKNNVTCDLIEEENKTGKQVILGYDKNGSVLLYLKDGLQNTEPSQRQVQQMIFMIDQCVLLNPKYVSKVTILVDFKHYPEVEGVVKKRKMTPLHIAKQCLHICQTYFPETLGYAVFINIPWVDYALLKLISPLIDPNTKQRLVFDEPFTNRIDPHNLDYHYGGDLKFDYDHETYWPDFKTKIEKRRKDNYESWLKLGGTIGLREVEFKP
ncbi:hypothetical protein ACO0SA_002541 [Hanseniaspora valbyensis]